MGKKLKLVCGALAVAGAIAGLAGYIRHYGIAVLQPKGQIADKQFRLIIVSTLLMLIVVLPVFWLTFWIAWKYRESNTKARYTPDWDHHPVLESIWWGLPCAIILVLAVVAWKSSHELDQSRPIYSSVMPLKVQVVAMDWKWLFIYPDHGIATVNYFEFPANRPVDFQITSDAPMNSFWIPSLGGQIYAMAGMSTQLHLIASLTGSYAGSSANLSGQGFAGMKFKAVSVSDIDFNDWVGQVSQSVGKLDMSSYYKLAAPSQDNPPANYAVTDPNVYDKVIMKYMAPRSQLQAMYVQSLRHGLHN